VESRKQRRTESRERSFACLLSTTSAVMWKLGTFLLSPLHFYDELGFPTSKRFFQLDASS